MPLCALEDRRSNTDPPPILRISVRLCLLQGCSESLWKYYHLQGFCYAISIVCAAHKPIDALLGLLPKREGDNCIFDEPSPQSRAYSLLSTIVEHCAIGYLFFAPRAILVCTVTILSSVCMWS